MDHHAKTRAGGRPVRPLILAAGLLSPAALLAQAAGSPFETGANSLVTFAQAIAVPFSALAIIGLAITAAIGKFSWGLAVGVLVSIALLFGAEQIVDWIRTLFSV